MEKENLYVGRIKEVNGKYGAYHNVWFDKDAIAKIMANLNADGGINLNLKPSRAGGLYLQINDFVPQKQVASGGVTPMAQPAPDDEELPF